VTGNHASPGPVREWATFPDPGDAKRRWLVDVTWLTSPWQCLFGCGCQGVLTGPTPELEQGCCSYGAHFTDEDDRDRVLAAAEDLRPDEWQYLAPGRRRGVTARLPKGGWRTRLVDGACVFLNRPGFGAGAGCALHVLALRQGAHPMATKPDVCWQLPLRKEDKEESDGTVTTTLSEFSRAGWGPGGDLVVHRGTRGLHRRGARLPQPGNGAAGHGRPRPLRGHRRLPRPAHGLGDGSGAERSQRRRPRAPPGS
jgi:hypothetical protein